MKTENIEAQKYFSEKAGKYYEEHYKNIHSKKVYPSLYLRHQYILEMLEDIKPGKALDIGCGSGAMVRDLLDKGFDVVAADISQNMLDATRKTVAGHSRAKHVEYTLQDIESMTLKSNAFDVVVCAGVIEYLKTDYNSLREIHRVLKPGGIAFISTQNLLGPNTLTQPLLHMLPARLRNKLVTVKQHRCHIPWRLDRNLKKVGFVKEDFAYHHFYPVIIPLDRLCKRFCVWLGKKMERWHKRKFAWLLATGYVVKVRKIGR